MLGLLNLMDGLTEGFFEGVISNWFGELIGLMLVYGSGIWQILIGLMLAYGSGIWQILMYGSGCF